VPRLAGTREIKRLTPPTPGSCISSIEYNAADCLVHGK
jgi:hypothetical protein